MLHKPDLIAVANVTRSKNPPEPVRSGWGGQRSVGRVSIWNFQKTMGFHLLTFKRPGIHSWRGCITLHYQQPQENCACQTIGWSILGFSVLLKRLKDALLFIFDNILLTRLWSVSTSADSPDGTPHAIFFLDLPSAATVQHGTKDKLDSELMHRLPLGAII